jgi:hypothetical protein
VTCTAGLTRQGDGRKEVATGTIVHWDGAVFPTALAIPYTSGD